MLDMLDVMKSIHNCFAEPDKAVYGTYTIENGRLSLPSSILPNQYYIIEGSALNDNVVHLNAEGEHNLTDETFTGHITPCSVPVSFVDVYNQITAYWGSHLNGNEFVSESFGGYSYTRPTKANGSVAGWRDVFKDQLDVWRKL